MTTPIPATLIPGDGIGPEIVDATVAALDALGAPFAWDRQIAGLGGVALLVRELLAHGLLHEDVHTVAGFGLQRYTQEPWLENGQLAWRDGPEVSLDDKVIARVAQPFEQHGGTKVLQTGEAGISELYAPRDGLPFTYPPFAALLFAGLATMSLGQSGQNHKAQTGQQQS